MSFLRSIITDARPRRPMHMPLHGPSAITGRKDHTLDGNALGADQTSPEAPDQTSHLSKSFSTREGASDVNRGNTSAFQVDNPLDQGLQEIRNSVDLGNPLSMPVDKSRPILDEESSTHLDPVALPEPPLDSNGDRASKAPRRLTQQPAGTIIPDSRINTPKGPDNDSSLAFPETHDTQHRASGDEETEPADFQASIRELPGKALTDTRHHSESSTKDPETLTTQADATLTTAATSPESAGLIESSGFKASLVTSVPSPDAFAHPTLDHTAGQNKVEKALADRGKARQVSSHVDKHANAKPLSDQKDIPRLQKLSEPKELHRDIKRVSRQAMAMASQGSSNMELATVPQTAGKAVSTSTSAPGSGSSEPGSPVQHIARPARPSASPEALRSVPARPFHTDLMPKDSDSFHSRPSLRPPERTHESPKVQIGQIDIIIEAAPHSAAKPAPAPSPVDLASRHYLRRL